MKIICTRSRSCSALNCRTLLAIRKETNEKFNNLKEFGDALEKAREQIQTEIKRKGHETSTGKGKQLLTRVSSSLGHLKWSNHQKLIDQ